MVASLPAGACITGWRALCALQSGSVVVLADQREVVEACGSRGQGQQAGPDPGCCCERGPGQRGREQYWSHDQGPSDEPVAADVHAVVEPEQQRSDGDRDRRQDPRVAPCGDEDRGRGEGRNQLGEGAEEPGQTGPRAARDGEAATDQPERGERAATMRPWGSVPGSPVHCPRYRALRWFVYQARVSRIAAVSSVPAAPNVEVYLPTPRRRGSCAPTGRCSTPCSSPPTCRAW